MNEMREGASQSHAKILKYINVTLKLKSFIGSSGNC